jgi:hypothetical protein
MVIKINNLAALGLVALLGLTCKKMNHVCPKLGYEYNYSERNVFYFPLIDSISLGDSILMEASAPKKFFDNYFNYNVTLNESDISGPFSISKVSGRTDLPVLGAMKDVELISVTGTIEKDSVNLSAGQLETVRTMHFDGSLPDSFKLKVYIKPKIKGVFFASLGQQGNRDIECALYKYNLKVANRDQHLYFLANANNGYVSDYENDHVYCFKVY